MIKLVENSKEAELVLSSINCHTAPLLAAKMFTEGFGVNQDFLQLYAAFDDKSKLSAAFVKCNDRVFCLIEKLYDIDEINLFLRGFDDFKIFIAEKFAYIIKRKDYVSCTLMKKSEDRIIKSNDIQQIDSKTFTNIIMNGKEKDAQIRFLLNNSHLQRHGYIKNYALKENDEILCLASLYENNESAYLCNVFTPIEYRLKGYASTLVSQVTDINKECHLICTESVSSLYEKCGFTLYAKWIEFLY